MYDECFDDGEIDETFATVPLLEGRTLAHELAAAGALPESMMRFEILMLADDEGRSVGQELYESGNMPRAVFLEMVDVFSRETGSETAHGRRPFIHPYEWCSPEGRRRPAAFELLSSGAVRPEELPLEVARYMLSLRDDEGTPAAHPAARLGLLGPRLQADAAVMTLEDGRWSTTAYVLCRFGEPLPEADPDGLYYVRTGPYRPVVVLAERGLLTRGRLNAMTRRGWTIAQRLVADGLETLPERARECVLRLLSEDAELLDSRMPEEFRPHVGRRGDGSLVAATAVRNGRALGECVATMLAKRGLLPEEFAGRRSLRAAMWMDANPERIPSAPYLCDVP